jgi:hypothetical protein
LSRLLNTGLFTEWPRRLVFPETQRSFGQKKSRGVEAPASKRRVDLLDDRAKKSTSRGWGQPLYMMAAQGPITLDNYFMATLKEAEKRIKKVLIFARSSPRICL